MKYRIRIRPITAIHIGTGDLIDPSQYSIIQNNQKYFLLRYRPETIINTLNDEERSKFNQLLDKDDYSKITLFLHDKVNLNNALYVCETTENQGLEFNKKRNNLNDNRLMIHAIYRNQQSLEPVIPGSSIKGAIRTAVINQISNEEPTSNYKRVGELEFESEILGYNKDIKKDPFRCLAVGDCTVHGKNRQFIIPYVNFKENRLKGDDFIEKMRNVNEAIRGYLFNGDAYGDFDLTIRQELLKSSIESNYGSFQFKMQEQFSISNLFKACSNFYTHQIKNEIDKFYKNSKHKKLRETAENLTKEIEKIDGKTECLIRLGRFSQVESVTVNKYRRPKAKNGYGNTRTLVNSLFPGGLAMLELISSDKP